jgi:hypothetical protein
MKRWEYLKRWDSNATELNRFGETGWELISVIMDKTNSLVYIFKREVLI